MAPHLIRAGYVATDFRNDLFFAVRYSLVPPATTLLSWPRSRTPQRVLQLLPSHFRPPVFLFVDNLYAINTGTGRWTAKLNLDAVAALTWSAAI